MGTGKAKSQLFILRMDFLKLPAHHLVCDDGEEIAENAFPRSLALKNKQQRDVVAGGWYGVSSSWKKRVGMSACV